MAALSFGCMGAVPPISWMGSKRGYSRVLMELLGLSRHNPPAAYIWGDVGPNVAALATLAGARGDARDVAGRLFAAAGGYRPGHPESGYNKDHCEARDKSHPSGANRALSDYLPEGVDPLPLPRAAEVAAIIRGWKDEEPRALWTRLKAAGWPSLMPPKGSRWGQPIVGRWLGPCEVGEVAGLLLCHIWQHPAGDKFAQSKAYPVHFKDDAGNVTGTWVPTDAVKLSHSVDALPSRWPRVACYQGTATRLVEQLPERLDNVIVYLDPPYSGTTGYKFGGCPREEVLRMALDLSGRGATVAISEAVRLDRELGDGWTAVQIDGERRGQKRTFSVQQHEWVTMNQEPHHRPGTQQGLFGGAR
jgi:hypothetical protein